MGLQGDTSAGSAVYRTRRCHGIQECGSLEQKAELLPNLIEATLPEPRDVDVVYQDASVIR